MTRQPFDEFSKQLFEALLSPYGRVTIDRTVAGEARRIDIYFEPNETIQPNVNELGLLANFSTRKCLFEPFRSSLSRIDVRNCAMKLYNLHAEILRAAERTLPDSELPSLWILAADVSGSALKEMMRVKIESVA
ncbi:MAG: hypothetical protein MUC48_09860 [Leptolyngbya sp. Prado105]|jgi:hypothetical protein|nr:hypothetical protein [Leptolyngbya sp. Prado105]